MGMVGGHTAEWDHAAGRVLIHNDFQKKKKMRLTLVAFWARRASASNKINYLDLRQFQCIYCEIYI